MPLNPESVVIVPKGFRSASRSRVAVPSPKSHTSNFVSLEKSSLSAPTLVPVANNGEPLPVDQAKTAVRSSVRNPTIVPEQELELLKRGESEAHTKGRDTENQSLGSDRFQNADLETLGVDMWQLRSLNFLDWIDVKVGPFLGITFSTSLHVTFTFPTHNLPCLPFTTYHHNVRSIKAEGHSLCWWFR